MVGRVSDSCLSPYVTATNWPYQTEIDNRYVDGVHDVHIKELELLKKPREATNTNDNRRKYEIVNEDYFTLIGSD